MLFRQIINEDLGCASYLIACSGQAAIVDPQLDIQPYLDLAAEHGLTITDVLETHNHADHVSGHGRLAEAVGVRIHVPAAGEVDYPHEPLVDGDEVHIGNVVLRVIATPGHRPEHVAFAVIDTVRSPEPWALLTGDSLLVGDIARPDLAVEAEEGAVGLHASIQRLTTELPAHAEVWPGHLGGSLCGSARLSGKPSSTLGFEQAANPMLGMADPAELEAALLEGLKPKPPNFEHIVARNQGPLHAAMPEPRAMSPYEVLEAQRSGVVILDTRAGAAFDEAHVARSVSVPVADGGFGTRASWQLSTDDRIILIAEDADAAADATMRLASVHIDNVVGILDGGMPAWQAAGLPVTSSRILGVSELATRLGAGTVAVLDVRDPDEFARGHVPGSTNIPFYDLTGEVAASVADLGEEVAVICMSGARAAQAVSMLQQAGITNALHVDGGGVLDLPAHGIELRTAAPA